MAQTDKKEPRNRITAYGGYVASLQRLAIEPRTAMKWQERTHAALNGEASAELRRLRFAENSAAIWCVFHRFRTGCKVHHSLSEAWRK